MMTEEQHVFGHPIPRPEIGCIPCQRRMRKMKDAERVYASGRGVDFQLGYDNSFSRDLSAWLLERGVDGLNDLAPIVLKAKYEDVSWEALRVIAAADSIPLADRLRLLIKVMESENTMVVDGALLGIAHIDHPAALEPLKNILKLRESLGKADPALRRNAQQVVEQLKATKAEEMSELRRLEWWER